MKKRILFLAVLFFNLSLCANISAQGFLKKLKDKASQVADKIVDKKVDNTVGVDNSSNNNTNTSSPNAAGRASNKTGEGLKNATAPDVNQQMNDAETAYHSASYADARYAVQQALLGVEIQMGKQILKSLPSVVSALPADTVQDKVFSSQWGLSNLTIQRIYKKEDKELNLVIGNNSAYAGFINILFAGNYAQSNGETQNFKQVKVRGNKAVIKFEQNEGYTLLIQMGQAGLITLQAVNFATEQDVMQAANTFDIDGIKKMLGEK